MAETREPQSTSVVAPSTDIGPPAVGERVSPPAVSAAATDLDALATGPVRPRPTAAVAALAIGALAIGAVAVGALAIGRLAIGALALRRGHIRSLAVDDLVVGRLRVGEFVVESATSGRGERVDYRR